MNKLGELVVIDSSSLDLVVLHLETELLVIQRASDFAVEPLNVLRGHVTLGSGVPIENGSGGGAVRSVESV